MSNVKNRLSPKIILLAIISIAGCALAINNFTLLSKDMIFGDFSAEGIFPTPYFGFFRIPDRANTIEHNATNRLAADYAQVYFPSQDFSSLTRNYETGHLDPWKRPSRYAPFVHYICRISFCKLDYGYASFFHMLAQIFLFYAFFIAAFRILKIESDLWLGLFLATLLLFATPAGLGWFERGQFSLYVALSYLLLLLGLLKDKPAFVIASAFFAYVKWTSFPFLFVVLAMYALSAKNWKDGIRTLRPALIYLAVILLLSLAFRSRFIHFLEGLYLQERNVEPVGISLAHILPAAIVKGLPFLLVIPGYLYLRKNNMDFNKLIPYFIGAGILLLTYPTVAFEYNIPNLLCFVPLVLYWTKNFTPVFDTLRATADKAVAEKTVPFQYVFFVFLLIISFPDYIAKIADKDVIMIGYLAVSSVWLLFPLLVRGDTKP